MITTYAYFIPFSMARDEKAARAVLLRSCIADGHLPEGTKDFPPGTRIVKTHPGDASNNKKLVDPTWEAQIPDKSRPGRQELENIIELALTLRAAQNAYFKSRSQADLKESKKLEAEFDRIAPGVLDRSRTEK